MACFHLLFFFALAFTASWALNAPLPSHFRPSSSSSLDVHKSLVKSLCTSAPYPETCFDTFKLSISIGINPDIISYLLQSLETALSEIQKLTELFAKAGGSSGIVEKQKGTVQDCQELHRQSLSSLKKSVDKINNAPDVKTYLSASLTNKVTCLEGLDSATGPLKPTLVNSMTNTYKYVSNSLALLSNPNPPGAKGRRLLGFPKWLSRESRRILQSSGDEYDPSSILTVAQDGTGNFTTISDAIEYAPDNSPDRIIIFVKQGLYDENVMIPSQKTNIVLLGDGNDTTVITGNRSVGDGWTTFRSATVAVSGEGFLARGLSIYNTAGPAKHQAVALRVNADLVALYQCSMFGYQDTLYVHSFRQFYRECDVYGTIDFIFGNAAVVFQGCNLVARQPLPGQSNAFTAQSRTDEYETTGMSIQNCSILAGDDLDTTTTKSYLGRPWRPYSRTVYIESFIDGLIDPAGWLEWSDNGTGLDTLYYGEYGNSGPGADTSQRVTWPGYHVMSYEDALQFTVSEFITGDEWLGFTSFPYDEGF
ncbi:probable pectinesterase/pectinesterase inhibitor 12 [Aristolochia californica]|uniref:probable pectinesterase/pectinesterase inhibitor 12 n=1 Tax=Aristolochia californica TaxID=171875 RepID=UPI0035D86545